MKITICDKCGASSSSVYNIKFPLDTDSDCRYRDVCKQCLCNVFCWLVKNSKLEFNDIEKMIETLLPEKE